MKTSKAIKKILASRSPVTLETSSYGAAVTVTGDGSSVPKIQFGSSTETPSSQWVGAADLRELAKFFKKLADALDPPAADQSLD